MSRNTIEVDGFEISDSGSEWRALAMRLASRLMASLVVVEPESADIDVIRDYLFMASVDSD
jgi:hypothetical protein